MNAVICYVWTCLGEKRGSRKEIVCAMVAGKYLTARFPGMKGTNESLI